MSSTVQSGPELHRQASRVPGELSFAGAMLIVGGAWHLLVGFAAVLSDTIFVTSGGSIYTLDLSTWGWIHLVIGVGAMVTGVFVLRGSTPARLVGVLLVALSVIVNFLFATYHPFWSVMIIILDLAVLWALCRSDEQGRHA